MTILVTGANGFVGRALVFELLAKGYQVNVLVRKVSADFPVEVGQVAGNLQGEALNVPLAGVDVLVHCAARVHLMQDNSANPLAEFRKVNRDATLALARLAANAGVQRFIFLSSIKVNGEMTNSHPNLLPAGKGLPNCFTPDDDFIPIDPYGLSKYEAEQGLLTLARESSMEVVIIRPPLVYGPGVKANFASMINWIRKGVPLPLGSIHNKRSFIALDNLVSFIALCADRTRSTSAANQIFLIADGENVSTTELFRKTAKALGKKPLLIPVSVSLMRFVAKLIGKEDVANRLFGSLQVDSSKVRKLLGWKPVTTMDEQLQKIAEALLNNEKNV